MRTNWVQHCNIFHPRANSSSRSLEDSKLINQKPETIDSFGGGVVIGNQSGSESKQTVGVDEVNKKHRSKKRRRVRTNLNSYLTIPLRSLLNKRSDHIIIISHYFSRLISFTCLISHSWCCCCCYYYHYYYHGSQLNLRIVRPEE